MQCRQLLLGPWTESKHITTRFQFIQRRIDLFWGKWTLYYFPHVITQQKWLYNERSLKVGDIAIIVDKNLPPGQWKLGKGLEVESGVDSKV